MRLEPCDAVYVSTSVATSVVSERPCIVHSAIIAPGSAASALFLIDPSGPGVTTSTNGTIKMHIHGVASGASNAYNGSGSGVVFNNGCLLVVTGAGAAATVAFAKI